MPSTIAPSPIYTMMSRHPTLALCTEQFLSWDTNLCIHINKYSTNYAVAVFFKTISRLGDGWFWYVMLASAFMIGGTQSILPLLTTIIMSLMGLTIYKLLKVKTVRPRPYQVHQVIVLGERPLDVFSFPSGHTLQAVLFTATLGSYFPQLLPIMLPFAALVALSRMVLGLHYPTDVLIGAGIGYGLSLWGSRVHIYLEETLPLFI